MEPNEDKLLRAAVGLRTGRTTSEYQTAADGTRLGRIVAILGTIVAILGSVGPLFGQDTIAAAIVGASVAVIGIVVDTLNRIAYIRSREQVKVAALTNPDAPAPGPGTP